MSTESKRSSNKHHWNSGENIQKIRKNPMINKSSKTISILQHFHSLNIKYKSEFREIQ